MNFMEAVREMDKGKKVRRPVWLSPAYIMATGTFHNYVDSDGNAVDWFCSALFLADDWEVIE